MSIIENIQNAMDKKQITPYQLEKAGIVKQTTFSSWKKGTQPALDKVIKVMQYIGVTPNELFGYNTESDLSKKEKELLELFRKLPDQKQNEYIIRMDEAVRIYQNINQNGNQSIKDVI